MINYFIAPALDREKIIEAKIMKEAAENHTHIMKQLKEQYQQECKKYTHE